MQFYIVEQSSYLHSATVYASIFLCEVHDGQRDVSFNHLTQ